MNKIKSWDEASEIIENTRPGKIVFTNGCFDVLHRGHVKVLREAKNQGDLLVLALNSDDSIKRLKGEKRPINTIEDRAFMVSQYSFVDIVVVFEGDTPYEAIIKLQPDVIVKGGDWENNVVGSDLVEARGGRVHIIPLQEGYSSTDIIDRQG